MKALLPHNPSVIEMIDPHVKAQTKAFLEMAQQIAKYYDDCILLGEDGKLYKASEMREKGIKLK